MSDLEKEDVDKKRPRGPSDEEEEHSKDEPIHSRLRIKKARASNLYSSSEEEISDDDKKKKSKGAKKILSKKSAAEVSSEDEVEDGEVSDGGSSSDENKYDDGYDEQLLGDEEDRVRLASMTEREREEEIFRRLEHRQALARRRELEKKLKNRANEGSKKKGLTKAVDDTSARSKERRLMVDGKKDVKAKAIENLRAAREQKLSRAAEQEKKKAAIVKPKKSESSSESDADDEEDLAGVEKKKVESSSSSDSASGSDDDDSEKKEERDASKEPIDSCEDIERLRLSRFRLIKWMYLPFFADLVKGCYVKVNFGDVKTGESAAYKIAEIVGVGESKTHYNTEINPKGRQHFTQITLRLRVVDKEKEMNLTYVSNSAVTPQEFSEFHSRMENHDTALPSRGFLEKKVRDMERATNYRMNDEDITRMVELKKKYAPRPVNVAMRKAELSKLKNAAVLNQDVEEAARLQEEIDELTSHSRQQDAPRFESQAKIHQINQRNNSLTMKALGDAMNSQQRVQSERGTDDPFTRRWGTPTMVHKKGGIAAAVLQIPGEKGAGGEVNGVHGQHSVPATGPVESATGVKADPFNMHNFELDIKIDMDDFSLASLPYSRRK